MFGNGKGIWIRNNSRVQKSIWQIALVSPYMGPFYFIICDCILQLHSQEIIYCKKLITLTKTFYYKLLNGRFVFVSDIIKINSGYNLVKRSQHIIKRKFYELHSPTFISKKYYVSLLMTFIIHGKYWHNTLVVTPKPDYINLR